jgi:aldehyde dehydrogenase (NAD+)
MTSPARIVECYVDGRWRAGPNWFEDRSPASPDTVVAEVCGADANLVDAALAAARRAFDAWRRTSPHERADRLDAVARHLDERAADIGGDIALEEGKTIGEGVAEAHGAAAQFRYAASYARGPVGDLAASRDPSTPWLFARREPVGVVACITPWNFPIAIPAWKIAHALACGNTVVWKPSEVTPLTSMHLAACLHDAELPAGVANMVLGNGPAVGAHVAGDAEVDAVSFTGSNAAGRAVAIAAATAGTRAQLEMGGSNASIVLADAKLTTTVDEIAKGAFLSAGQKCTATSRVIVDAAVYDEFVDALVERTRRFVVGDPSTAGTDVGPVATEAQYRRLRGFLDETETVAKVVAGGAGAVPDGLGWYLPLTVVLADSAEHEPFLDEIFGPATVVFRADGYDDAVRQVEASRFGLSASIFTADLDCATRFVDDVDCGVVKVNKATTGNEPQVPFGGHKASGTGAAEAGPAAREFFTQWKSVYVGSPGP